MSFNDDPSQGAGSAGDDPSQGAGAAEDQFDDPTQGEELGATSDRDRARAGPRVRPRTTIPRRGARSAKRRERIQPRSALSY